MTAFLDVYTKFKLHFYRKIFSRFEVREASLTAVETFCVEVINALNLPTVHEFARFVDISQANAAYKIQNLIEKGYVSKVRDENDKREYHLAVTEKYYAYEKLSNDYLEIVMSRIRDRFSKDETDTFERILRVMADDLMAIQG
jgi:DNA-binding MarR family transcriptional regulator